MPTMNPTGLTKSHRPSAGARVVRIRPHCSYAVRRMTSHHERDDITCRIGDGPSNYVDPFRIGSWQRVTGYEDPLSVGQSSSPQMAAFGGVPPTSDIGEWSDDGSLHY
jgi:hypothetical protein